MRNTKDLTLSRPAKEALQLLAALINNARKEKRWTQSELAERLGVSRKIMFRAKQLTARWMLWLKRQI